MSAEVLLSIRNLETSIQNGGQSFPVVDGMNLDVRRGEVVALVGESGSGKTLTAWSVMRLLPEPTVRVTKGSISFNGRDLLRLADAELQRIRGRELTMIFQEPGSALNPVMSCGKQIAEVLSWHLKLSHSAARLKTLDLISEVGLADPEAVYSQYPHQLSGGMKQRILIAMALACDPLLLIADEPTSSLDVTVQAQILELIRREQQKRRMSVLLITHDFGVVAQMADRVAVMYASRIVEVGETKTILTKARHPYTLGLLRSIPQMDEARSTRPMAGSIPDLRRRPAGCVFHPRCQWTIESCRSVQPDLVDVEGAHQCACTEWPRIQ